MNRFRVAPLARSDLDEIHDYIARDKPKAAQSWLDRTMAKFALLAANPTMGQARDELRPNLRCVSQGNYIIFFRQITDQNILEIARVIHAARDISELTF
jgi:toxin ParE1/3/4